MQTANADRMIPLFPSPTHTYLTASVPEPEHAIPHILLFVPTPKSHILKNTSKPRDQKENQLQNEVRSESRHIDLVFADGWHCVSVCAPSAATLHLGAAFGITCPYSEGFWAPCSECDHSDSLLKRMQDRMRPRVKSFRRRRRHCLQSMYSKTWDCHILRFPCRTRISCTLDIPSATQALFQMDSRLGFATTVIPLPV